MDSALARDDVTHGQLRALHLTESPDDLSQLGFAPSAPVGSTILVPSASALGASIDGVRELDGLLLADVVDMDAASDAHPNGVVSIDHVVVMTPNPDRTQAAFEANGLEARRVRRFETKRGPQRQTFFWLGDVICEVAGPDDGHSDDPASWWGLALTVADIDATSAFYGDDATPVKDAVQPGRRVCTLRSSTSRTPTLFISAHVRP